MLIAVTGVQTCALPISASSLICYLNGFEEAEQLMQEARKYLKKTDEDAYRSLKEALRILRKVRYN